MMQAQRIAQISQSLERARAAVAEGAKLDLDGLCAAVEAAIADAATAPLAERGALAAALGALMQTLDRLAADLGRQQHAEAQLRATAAYGASSGRGESEI